MSLLDRRWNIEQCNRCHQCKFVPTPKSKRFSAACPAMQYGYYHAYSASGKLISAYALMEGRLEYTPEALETLTACSMCGACDTACRTSQGDMVAPLDTLYELRSKIYEDGRIPEGQKVLVENIIAYGNPMGLPSAQRAAWASGLQIKDAGRLPVEVLLHVGCGTAFDSSQWPSLVWVADLLKTAGIDFGILGEKEPHAGGLAYDLGHQALARECADATASMIRASHARTVVTMDAHALAAFRSIYPRLGVDLGDLRILHITEFLVEFDLVKNAPGGASADRRVTYHDPCRLGRLSEPYQPWAGKWGKVLNGMRVCEPEQAARFGLGGVYDAPRDLLRARPGTTLVEMERTREFSFCCGSGAGTREAHPEFADQAANERVEEAAATGATILVSSCAGCVKHLGYAARRSHPEMRVVNLLDYLAADDRH